MDVTPGSTVTAQHSGSGGAGQSRSDIEQAQRRFYARMSWVCLIVAFVGFAPSFLLPLAQGQFARPPVFYIHAVLFFGWVTFLCAQAWMAVSGRVAAHRHWGILGAVIAALMGVSVIAVAVSRMNEISSSGSLQFAPAVWVAVAELIVFETCVTLALISIGRPANHRRLILLGTLSLLRAPLIRWTTVIFGAPVGVEPAPAAILFVQIAYLLLLVIPVIHEVRLEGRVSRIYAIGVPVIYVFNLVAFPLATMPPLLALADWIKHIGG